MPQPSPRLAALSRVVFVLAFAGALVALSHLPTGGGDSAAAGCPVAGGSWKGNFKQHVKVTSNLIPDRTLIGDIDQAGLLAVKVACNGKVTGAFTNVKYLQTETTVKSGVKTVETLCEGNNLRYNITDGTVETTGAGVEFTLKIFGNYGAMTCKDGTPANRPNTIVLRSTQVAKDTLRGVGGANVVEDALMTMIADNWEVLGPVTRTGQWLLEYHSPVLGPVDARLVRYFIAGIPVQNAFTVPVDWNKGKPGKVIFELGELKATKPGQGDKASHTFNVGALKSTTLLEVTAVNAEGDRSEPATYKVQVVPLPSWARPADLKATIRGDHVLYRGSINYPKAPLQANVSLPDAIPYAGGKWGLLPTQLRIGIVANSAGGKAIGDVTGKGGLGFGGTRRELKVDGTTTTSMSESGLVFVDGNVKLAVAKFSVTEKVDLLDIVPGIRAAYEIPLVGDLVKSLGGIARVQATLSASLAGHADLDVRAGALKIVGGKATVKAGVKVDFDVNLQLAFLEASGGGEGTLTIKFSPAPSVASCGLDLQFVARGGVLGKEIIRRQKSYSFSACGGAPHALRASPEALLAA